MIRHALVILVAASIFVSSAERLRADAPKAKLHSPRLEALAVAIESGDADALESFWKQVEEEGTPLVEPIDGDENYVLLTFLWRAEEDLDNVQLVGGVASGDFRENGLARLGETDLWFKTYRIRDDLRASYRFSPNDPLTIPDIKDTEALKKRLANYRHDPLNAKKYIGGGSLIELAGAPPQPWIEKNDAAEGEIRREKEFHSDLLDNDRAISVYLPPGYDENAEPYHVLWLFDASAYLTLVPTPRILNNLIAAGEIPPTVAVLIGNAKDARNTELPCNERFAEFLADELFPWVRERYKVSHDREKNVMGGSSYGGLASSFFALAHPELVGNVLSQSGSYWWAPDWDWANPSLEVEGEWLTRKYALAELPKTRFYLDVGIHEPGRPSMRVVNRHFRNVLEAKGHEVVRYVEYNGGHEYLVWRGTLADGLIALIGGGPDTSSDETPSEDQPAAASSGG